LEEDEDAEDGDEWFVQLNHLDRICFGTNTIFIFKYPLLEIVKEQKMEEIIESMEE